LYSLSQQFQHITIEEDGRHFIERHKVPGTQFTVAIPARNGKRKHYVEVTDSLKSFDELGGTQKRHKKVQQGEFFHILGGEDQRAFLENLVKQKTVKKVAKDVLDINLNFGAAESLKVKNHVNLNHRQLAGIRRMGVKMSGFRELREQEEKLFFEYEMVKKELECGKVKTADEYKGPGRVLDGVVLEEKTFVRAKSLKEVIGKVMEQRCFHHPSNVPHKHSSLDPEVTEQIKKFQQLLIHIYELEEVGKQLGEKDARTTGLAQLIKKRKEEVRRLQQELQEYENESGEQFVMMIGDYGGASFKMLLSNICSMEPNSPSSGFLIAEMPCKETINNLREVVGLYKEQINEMQDQLVSFHVNGVVVQKVVRVFLGGDYQFLAMMYGHGGANSTDFCLFCDCTQCSRSSAPKDGMIWGDQGWKTLERLMEQTNREPIFDIPPIRIVPIPLHIILGLTKEYLTMFRDDLKKLDKEDPGSNSDVFTAALRENEEAEIEMLIHTSELKEAREELEMVREGCKVCALMREKLTLAVQKCCVAMKGDKHCNNPGKAEYHLFCGHHKQRADPIFQKTVGAALSRGGVEADTVKEGLLQTNTADKKLRLTQALKEEEDALKELERLALVRISGLEEEVEKAERRGKSAKEDMSKVKGHRESTLFRVIREDIKAKIEPFHGELTMAGPSCLKVLENAQKLLDIVADEPELVEKYGPLFTTLHTISGLILKATPLRGIDLHPLEAELLLQGEELLENDIDHLEKLCHQLGDHYGYHFHKKPIPKQHILVYHVPQFARRYWSVGMFSEQAIEHHHAKGNTINRRLRCFRPHLALERKFKDLMLQAALHEPSKK